MDAGLALLHAPKDQRNTTEEEGSTYATNNTSDDLLVGVADTTAVVVVACLCGRWVCEDDLTGSGEGSANARRSRSTDFTVAQGRDDSRGEVEKRG